MDLSIPNRCCILLKNETFKSIIPFIKPLNVIQIKEIADQYSDIIILEEHQKSCGVGSAIIEQINDLYAYGKLSVYPKIKRIAIQDKFYSISGSQDYLRKIAGLILS